MLSLPGTCDSDLLYLLNTMAAVEGLGSVSTTLCLRAFFLSVDLILDLASRSLSAAVLGLFCSVIGGSVGGGFGGNFSFTRFLGLAEMITSAVDGLISSSSSRGIVSTDSMSSEAVYIFKPDILENKRGHYTRW